MGPSLCPRYNRMPIYKEKRWGKGRRAFSQIPAEALPAIRAGSPRTDAEFAKLYGAAKLTMRNIRLGYRRRDGLEGDNVEENGVA